MVKHGRCVVDKLSEDYIDEYHEKCLSGEPNCINFIMIVNLSMIAIQTLVAVELVVVSNLMIQILLPYLLVHIDVTATNLNGL